MSKMQGDKSEENVGDYEEDEIVEEGGKDGSGEREVEEPGEQVPFSAGSENRVTVTARR